ncbi:hypothetical protein [Clostridium botulinum]|uniref:hypothetical protein n=1 Tax=Clostridium botulinum TaxID=1491 RepID=UPI0013964FC2|nr:hypothetical protein [Clostridium botulinum]MCD3204256.1 hypothetical protein [Clostridium botulinum C/D]MCD3224020.1 hypothetical protein [Clostridium botulinum C/D]MCD3231666.1 hypothetical protein [Clostridium botulinum C/D]MCD3254923.1 hypothetical protein [Clostridium botulinum C/D]MCD3274661.1 hypothetical protein [Clostridium botulinum C/D]
MKASTKDKCTVLKGTLAWSLDDSYDESICLGIDLFVIYEGYTKLMNLNLFLENKYNMN